MIKRCNDFGAGGVSVAIGELADGLDIDLNAVPQEVRRAWTAPSWPSPRSQERMAVVVRRRRTWTRFIAARRARKTSKLLIVATVTDKNRAWCMTWNGDKPSSICPASSSTSNGCRQARTAACRRTAAPSSPMRQPARSPNRQNAAELRLSLKHLPPASGLVERFDGTIGAGTVLMPFGGKYQLHPDAGHGGHACRCSTARPTTCLRRWRWALTRTVTEQQPVSRRHRPRSSSRVAKLVAAGCRARRLPTSLSRNISSVCGKEPEALGQAALPPCWARCNAQVDLGARLPSAARTPCPARSTIWMCRRRWSPLPSPPPRRRAPDLARIQGGWPPGRTASPADDPDGRRISATLSRRVRARMIARPGKVAVAAWAGCPATAAWPRALCKMALRQRHRLHAG